MNNRVIAVVGPTASGKTRLAVEIAKRYNGEIVSADSMQVYKYMDIGTAKPTDEEMQGIPHHLISIVEPTETFTLQDYLERAKACVDDILSRGKIPVIAGGTGLYVTSFIENISLSEAETDPEYREHLAKRAEKEGSEKLLAELAEIDPQTAEKLHPNNIKRIIRALELYHTSGKTVTEQNEISKKIPSPYKFLEIGLRFSDRSVLYSRIDRRVDEMFSAGLENEISTLLQSGKLTRECNAFQAIGYKQFAPYFDGKIGINEVSENIKRESRRYAKRQLTWLRRDENIRWIEVDGLDIEHFFNNLSECIEEFLYV